MGPKKGKNWDDLLFPVDRNPDKVKGSGCVREIWIKEVLVQI